MKGFSFFEVPKEHEKEILSSLGKFKWNNFKCGAELSKPREEDKKENKRKTKKSDKGFRGKKRKSRKFKKSRY